MGNQTNVAARCVLACLGLLGMSLLMSCTTKRPPTSAQKSFELSPQVDILAPESLAQQCRVMGGDHTECDGYVTTPTAAVAAFEANIRQRMTDRGISRSVADSLRQYYAARHEDGELVVFGHFVCSDYAKKPCSAEESTAAPSANDSNYAYEFEDDPLGCYQEGILLIIDESINSGCIRDVAFLASAPEAYNKRVRRRWGVR